MISVKKVSKKLLALTVSLVLIFCSLSLPIASASTVDVANTQSCLDLTEYTFDNIPEQLLKNITADDSEEKSLSDNKFKTENCTVCYSEKGYSSFCIMADMQVEDMSNDMSTWLCAQCKEDIKTHLMKYFHQEH